MDANIYFNIYQSKALDAKNLIFFFIRIRVLSAPNKTYGLGFRMFSIMSGSSNISIEWPLIKE